MGLEELLGLNPPAIAIMGDSSTPISELKAQQDELMALTSLSATQANRFVSCL